MRGLLERFMRRSKDLRPILPSEIESIHTHDMEEGGARITTTKAITSGSRKSITNIERELNIGPANR